MMFASRRQSSPETAWTMPGLSGQESVSTNSRIAVPALLRKLDLLRIEQPVSSYATEWYPEVWLSRSCEIGQRLVALPARLPARHTVAPGATARTIGIRTRQSSP